MFVKTLYIFSMNTIIFRCRNKMTDNVTLTRKEIIELATDLTCAYLSDHHVSLEEIDSVMHTCFQLLNDLNKASGSNKSRLPVAPAVPIEDSIADDYIVCLEDGKKLQMLKRHLSTVYKMTVDEYKERWGLGADYPIVAPSYARRRSDIAKNTGLGKAGRRSKLKVVDSRSGSAVLG